MEMFILYLIPVRDNLYMHEERCTPDEPCDICSARQMLANLYAAYKKKKPDENQA